jgi:hypothetical protein
MRSVGNPGADMEAPDIFTFLQNASLKNKQPFNQ